MQGPRREACGNHIAKRVFVYQLSVTCEMLQTRVDRSVVHRVINHHYSLVCKQALVDLCHVYAIHSPHKYRYHPAHTYFTFAAAPPSNRLRRLGVSNTSSSPAPAQGGRTHPGVGAGDRYPPKCSRGNGVLGGMGYDG